MRPTPIPPHLRKGVACSILLAFVMACNHFNRDAPGVIEEQLRLDPKLDVTPERYSTMTALYFPLVRRAPPARSAQCGA